MERMLLEWKEGDVKNRDLSGLVVTTAAGGVCLVVGFALFMLLRRCLPYYYAPKSYLNHEDRWVPDVCEGRGGLFRTRKHNVDNSVDNIHDINRIQRPKKDHKKRRVRSFLFGKSRDDRHGPFCWIRYLWIFNENNLLYGPGGSDAVLYLRFLRYCMIYFIIIGILGLAAILPVNLTSGNKILEQHDLEWERTGSVTWSIANIPDDDNRLWVHLISVWVFSLLAYLLVRQLLQSFLEFDHGRLYKDSIRNRSVIIRHIPQHFASNTYQLTARLKKIWGEEKVVYVSLLRDLRALIKLQEKRSKQALKWQRCVEQYDAACRAQETMNQLFNFHTSLMSTNNSNSNANYNNRDDNISSNSISTTRSEVSNNDHVINIPAGNINANNSTNYINNRHTNDISGSNTNFTAPPKYQFSKRPTHKHGKKLCCVGGQPVDSIDHYAKTVKEYDEEISKMIEEADSETEPTTTAIVTFDCARTAMECCQTLHYDDPFTFSVIRAPSPRDINWKYLVTPSKYLFVRRLLTYVVLAALYIVWAIPITLLSSFSNLSSLLQADVVGYFENHVQEDADKDAGDTDGDEAFWQGVIHGLIPTALLLLFLAICPYLIRLILSQRGLIQNSRLARSVCRNYWLFLFLNLFVLSTVTGSVVTFKDEVQQVLSQPIEMILEIIATSFPAQSLFVINYLVLQGCNTDNFFVPVGYPFFRMCRLHHLITDSILYYTTRRTREEKQKLKEPRPFDYAKQYGRELLAFSLGLIYSTMYPLILPFVAFYFFLGYATSKYNLVFVFSREDHGLRMTTVAVNIMLLSILLYQIVMTAVLGLKRFEAGFSIVILIIITCTFKWYFNRRYFKPSRYMPIVSCPAPTTPVTLNDIKQKWQHPALVPPSPLCAPRKTSLSPLPQHLQQQQKQQYRTETNTQEDGNNVTISMDSEVRNFSETSSEEQGTPQTYRV